MSSTRRQSGSSMASVPATSRIHVFDCTLRDAGYAVQFQFSASHTRQIAGALETCGLQYIEVGHGLGLGASGKTYGIAAASDAEYLKAVSGVLRQAQYGMFFIPGIAQEHHLDLLRDHGASFVRFGCNVTEFENLQPFMSAAKRRGLTVFVNLLKTYTAPPERFARIVKQLHAWGEADVIYLVDSAGCMLPAEIRTYVHLVKEQAPGIRVGLHAHDNLRLATANVLAAIECGCEFIDTTLRGVGRSAGNAQTEVVLALLPRLGYNVTADLLAVLDVSRQSFLPMLESLARMVPSIRRQAISRGVSDIELIEGLARCHSGFLPQFRAVARRRGVDLRRLIMAVSKIDCVEPSRELMEEVAGRMDGTSGRDVRRLSRSVGR